jgi:phosphohistidine phosphatase
MLIHIFRHGKADFGMKGVDDPGLNDQGRKDIKNVVKLFRSWYGFKPNVIASSPLLRAKETAELTKSILKIRSEILVDQSLYGDKKPREVYSLLAKFKKNDSIVLVFHMPLIFELLYDLIGARAEIDLPNGSIACIECQKPKAGKGKLLWLAPLLYENGPTLFLLKTSSVAIEYNPLDPNFFVGRTSRCENIS